MIYDGGKYVLGNLSGEPMGEPFTVRSVRRTVRFGLSGLENGKSAECVQRTVRFGLSGPENDKKVPNVFRER